MTPPRATKPEEAARQNVDVVLGQADWLVQDAETVNLRAARGVAVREFPLKGGYGFADYLLYIDGRAVGVVEAKKEGAGLTGVEVHAERYGAGPTPLTARRSGGRLPPSPAVPLTSPGGWSCRSERP
jgi:type I restriction enzyme, R subunit